MVFKVFSQFIVLLLCLSISAAMPDQLSIGKGGGVFRIGGLEFRLAHFTPGYKQYTRQPGDAFFLPSPSMEWPLRFNGTFRTPTGVFKLTESFSKEGAATVRYEGRLDAAQAVASAELFLITTLPATEFAGENLRVNQIPLLLPARPEKPMRIVRNEVTELMIPLNHGTLVISGNNFRIQVADNRSSGRNTFTLRFYPICDQPGKIGNAEFSLAFNYRGINSFPLDLSRAANMDFADETPGDGKGGWTDQGPTNDLRMFQPGLRVFNGIKFQVIDPRKNHGKSCLVLRGENLPTLPDSAAIELPSNVRGASYLYLLHAAGWTKPHSRLGSVEITYPGQLRQREDLTVGIDAGNWWNPENLPNGTVVWRDHNDHAALGTEFEILGAAVWFGFAHIFVDAVGAERLFDGDLFSGHITGLGQQKRANPRNSIGIILKIEWCGKVVVETVRIDRQSKSGLLEIAHATDRGGALSRLIQRRQQHRGQDGDNRNNY